LVNTLPPSYILIPIILLTTHTAFSLNFCSPIVSMPVVSHSLPLFFLLANDPYNHFVIIFIGFLIFFTVLFILLKVSDWLSFSCILLSLMVSVVLFISKV
jgi:hypothetical protein